MKQKTNSMYTKVTMQDGRIYFTNQPILFVHARGTIFIHVLIEGEQENNSNVVAWREGANCFSAFEAKHIKFIS